MGTNEYTISELLLMGIRNWRSGIPAVVLILSHVLIFSFMRKRGISIDSEEKVRERAKEAGRYAIAELRNSSFSWTKDNERRYCGNYEFEVNGRHYRKSAWFWHNPPQHLMFYWKRTPARAKPESVMGKGNLWVYAVPWVLAVIVYSFIAK